MSAEVAKQIGLILKDQIELQKLVHEALSSLRRALQERDIEKITATIHQQDLLTEKMATLEKERIKICASLDGIVNPTAPLTVILQRLPEKYHDRLRELRAILKVAIQENSLLGSSNTILLEEALINTRKGVEILAQTQRRPTGYGPRGTTEDFKRNLINRKG